MDDHFKFQVDHGDARGRSTLGESARQSKGTMIVWILMVCLTLLMIAGFFYLNQRLSNTRSSKTQAVNTLSQNLEDRFSSLSVKQARLEDDLEEQKKIMAQKLTGMETATQKEQQEIETQLTQAEQRLAEKIGPKQLQQAIAAVEKKIGALDADLTDMADQLAHDREKNQALASSMTGQLNEFENILNETAKSVIDLETDLVNIANHQLDT